MVEQQLFRGEMPIQPLQIWWFAATWDDLMRRADCSVSAQLAGWES
jgi:hypothetical protein